MNEIKLNFLHPTDGRIITVNVDDTMTAQEAIGELLSASFLPPNPQGYQLLIKGGALINPNQSFASAGAKNDDTIRVVTAIDAGRTYFNH